MARSAQSFRPFGLSGLTSNTTEVVETIPPSVSEAGSCVMRPASLISWASGMSDSATMSALRPLMTA